LKKTGKKQELVDRLEEYDSKISDTSNASTSTSSTIVTSQGSSEFAIELKPVAIVVSGQGGSDDGGRVNEFVDYGLTDGMKFDVRDPQTKTVLSSFNYSGKSYGKHRCSFKDGNVCVVYGYGGIGLSKPTKASISGTGNEGSEFEFLYQHGMMFVSLENPVTATAPKIMRIE
jgi:hypothetical protein